MGCCGGFVGKVFDTVVDAPAAAIETVNNVVIDPTLSVVKDAGETIDNVIVKPVGNVLSWAKENPVEAALLVAGGYYFAPEIGAWISADGAAIAGTAAGTETGAAVLTAEEVAAQQAATAAAAQQAAAAGELTAAEVNALVASEQAANMTAAEVNAMIAEEAATAAAATPSQVAAAKIAGMSTLDYLRGGLLLNAVTGDPLKLGGSQPSSGGGGGTTGFAMVPIPKEWQIPTYAAPSAPIDLSSIFTDQNLLAGTQWQGLPTQQPNVSFNDIFASGQQQTPMGNMVDINQIVSSILGQNTASQKSS